MQESDQIGLPTKTYLTKEEVDENGNLNRLFTHAPNSIAATPEEDVGVESLLRGIKDAS